MFGPINKKKKKQEKNQINKTLKSKFIYEDCFVYDESRFTGTLNIEYMKSKIYPCKQVLSAKNNSFSIHL